jgi:hypothetical protein
MESSSPEEYFSQVHVYETDYESIKELQADWELQTEHDVIRKLLELAMQAKDLKEKLVDAQSKLSELKAQSLVSNVEDLIKRLVDERFKELTANAATLSLTPTPQPNAQPEIEAPQSTKDWRAVPSDELRKSKVQGAADEKIRRSFVAISKFNDYTAKDLNEKWAINNRALRQLSGAHGDLVKNWMERHQLSIDNHNTVHGLSQYHNKCHKEAITDMISW